MVTPSSSVGDAASSTAGDAANGGWSRHEEMTLRHYISVMRDLHIASPGSLDQAGLWREISRLVMAHGVRRTPAECRSYLLRVLSRDAAASTSGGRVAIGGVGAGAAMGGVVGLGGVGAGAAMGGVVGLGGVGAGAAMGGVGLGGAGAGIAMDGVGLGGVGAGIAMDSVGALAGGAVGVGVPSGAGAVGVAAGAGAPGVWVDSAAAAAIAADAKAVADACVAHMNASGALHEAIYKLLGHEILNDGAIQQQQDYFHGYQQYDAGVQQEQYQQYDAGVQQEQDYVVHGAQQHHQQYGGGVKHHQPYNAGKQPFVPDDIQMTDAEDFGAQDEHEQYVVEGWPFIHNWPDDFEVS